MPTGSRWSLGYATVVGASLYERVGQGHSGHGKAGLPQVRAPAPGLPMRERHPRHKEDTMIHLRLNDGKGGDAVLACNQAWTRRIRYADRFQFDDTRTAFRCRKCAKKA